MKKQNVKKWLPVYLGGFGLLASLSLISAGTVQAAEAGMGSGTAEGVVFTDMSGTPLNNVVQSVFLNASARIRPEYSDDFDFDSSTEDETDFISNRFRLGIGAHLTGDITLYIEAQNNSTWGDDTTLGPNSDMADDDDFKVYRAFGEVRQLFGSPLGLKIGRQELLYGTEMLLGDADFGPGLSHDAILLSYSMNNLTVDAWWSVEVESDLIDPADDDADFLGIYGMWQAMEGSGIDLYWLYLNDDQMAVQEKRHTIGTRVYHRMLDFVSLGGEVAWQFGETGPAENDIDAFGFEATAGFDLSDRMPMSPNLEIGYAFATGDADPGVGDVETFNPLFQDNHPRLGFSDLLVLSNLNAVSVKGTIQPWKQLGFGAAYYTFWVDEPGDTNAPGNFSPGANPNADDSLGQELNLFANFQYTKYISGQLTWAHFFADDYVTDTLGTDDDADRVYLHLVFAF